MIEKFLNLTLVKGKKVAPLYLQLSSEIIQLIRSGVLKPGSPLPASRELAVKLQINRKTVVAAYEELDAQSWIAIKPRSGVVVAAHLPEVQPRQLNGGRLMGKRSAKTAYPLTSKWFKPGTVKIETRPALYTLNDGFPDTRLAPVDLLVREYRRLGKNRATHKYLMYGPAQGSVRLRQALVQFLSRTRGMQITTEEILITKGTQMAIYLMAQLLIRPGDLVLVPEPGYLEANETFVGAGAKLALIPVDADGMDVDAIERICGQHPVRMIYVIPHHHRPTTATLSADRRMRLMALAAHYKFALIEDDYDYDYHFASNPLLPLASLDENGSIIYVGSFCKTIAPGVRIGFMVAPEPVIQEATALRKLIDRQGELLLEEAMATLLEDGDIDRHLKKTQKLYHERRDFSCELLATQMKCYLDFETPDGGLAIWAKYKGDLRSAEVSCRAAALGLNISRGDGYFQEPVLPAHEQYIRIGFCSMNQEEMGAAVNIWKEAIHTLC